MIFLKTYLTNFYYFRLSEATDVRGIPEVINFLVHLKILKMLKILSYSSMSLVIGTIKRE